uniref:hypothetical protein n=1 Tax=Lachnospira sp. TaxID=2049031 RepID=UPI003FEFB731
MSRLIRVSDDIYSALEIIQPDGWSMPKTIDAMLRPVINAISKVVTETDGEKEDFPVRIKKITEEIIAVLPQALSSDETKNDSEIFEDGNDNISSEELENIYEELNKLNMEIEKIKKQLSGGSFESITENERNLLKLFTAKPSKECPSNAGFFGEPYVEAPPDEIRYYTQHVTKRIPASLPSNNGWNNFCWTIDIEKNQGALLRNAENIIAKFSVPDKKIMISSDELVFVWYDFDGTFDEMIAECEKRVAKKYVGRETLWIIKSLAHMTTPQRDELRLRQQIINEEMRKRGLKEYDTVSII